jgi:environmental stress-induced protein Ves
VHRLIAPADYRRMPWKNGRGRTTEIASGPPGAPLDGFDWRVSVADVDADGPFSQFPGIERTIALIAGGGMRLAIGGRDVEIRAPFEPYTFDGEEAAHCTLIAGAVRDFNLMVRRDRTRGVVTVVRDGGARIAGARIRIVYACVGAVEALLPAHPPVSLPVEHALEIIADDGTEGTGVSVNPLAPDAVAIVASIDTLG